MDIDSLSPKAKAQYKNTLAVYEHPDDKGTKLKFLEEFTRDFSVFMEIFQPDNFKQLYSGSYIHIELLDALGNEFPEKTVNLLLSLSKDAHWEADATGNLQRTVQRFAVNHHTLFIDKFRQISDIEQKAIATYLADMEGIKRSVIFQQLLDQLKYDRNLAIYDLFYLAKQNRMKERH